MTQPPVRPGDLRASDPDRELVQDWLRRAHADGSLDLEEFDARVVHAWQARTRGDLAALTADLPQVPTPLLPTPLPLAPPAAPPSPAPLPPGRRAGVGRTVLRVLTTLWLSVSAVNLVVWFLVSVLGGNGFAYPWFLWVALVPGSVLGSVWLTTRR
ncbi:DUF1707 SHOCT-like domain-containing protein [Saccharothrix yanglingensis]|uniref:DUF1707 SHOCT-like domain-containing protein n=1 Tax=Saccharothrix yanglingensis TaxID=659496 RepID=UPI0027D2B3E7|nr:DUF1707 domain-containing protein [Saccharothrix yanglingensis]